MASVGTKSMKKDKKPGIQSGKNPSAIELIVNAIDTNEEIFPGKDDPGT